MDELFENTPLRVLRTVDMHEPNTPIPIHEGDFSIQIGDKFFDFTGIIEYQWMPDSGATITAQSIDTPFMDFLLARQDNTSNVYMLFINDLQVGKVLLTKCAPKGLDNTHIEGCFEQHAVIGSLDKNADEVLFAIPNLRVLYGTSIRESNYTQISYYNGRVTFLYDNLEVQIDRVPEYHGLQKKLQKKGGFIVNHHGRLSTLDNSPITYHDSNYILFALRWTLSFVNGRWVSPLFAKGMWGGEALWQNFSNSSVDRYYNVHSWYDAKQQPGLEVIWHNLNNFLNDPEISHLITTAIHWYVEANCQSGAVEGSIIMAQTGLELMYNWIIVTRKRLMLATDSRQIVASDKIRLLLNEMGMNAEIPDGLAELKEFSSTQKYNDGAFVITDIRNIIVHTKSSKKIKYSDLTFVVKQSVLKLSLYYLEHSILYILGYSGNVYLRWPIAEGDKKSFIQSTPWSDSNQ